MEFRLKKHEPFFAGCQRVACEEIAAVLQDLHACAISENPAEAVHDARCHLKRLQALFRVLRPAIGEEAFVRERGRFRRAAQRLASARDAEVSMRTLEQLRELAARETQPALAAALRIFAAILSHHRVPPQRTLDAIAASLVEAGAAIREWTFAGGGSKALAKGVERLYRRARKAGGRAAETPSTEGLHKWRQTTKELWSALRLLRSLEDKQLKWLTRAAGELGELLGDDHDLAILGDALRGEPVAAALGADAVSGIERLIEAERARLQRKAWKVGKKLYGEKARKVGKIAREI